MIRSIKKLACLGIIVCLIAIVVSCEEDFTDIGSNIVSNTKFDTNSFEIDVAIENSPLTRIQSDNISVVLGQYLLGVYNNPQFEKIEASIVSQLRVPTTPFKVVDRTYGADTTVVTKIDTVFLRIPYQSTFIKKLATGPDFRLDSVFGDTSKAFTLNVFRSNTFINQFNPLDPTKNNQFFSDATFEKSGATLTAQPDYQFIPNKNDTLIAIKRRLHNDKVFRTDTVKISISTTTNPLPVPFARIPLDESMIKQLFLDRYETGEFASQATFNDYFRGLILEATGNEGSLLSLNFNNTNANLVPSLEIYYTNTVLKSGTIAVDTIAKNNSFPLSGFRVNTYKMQERTYPVNNKVVVQGTAGSEAKITLLTNDDIINLRSKNWLINDATLTFYIDQSTDTTFAPSRLSIYKAFNNNVVSQVKDAASELGFQGIGGFLQRDSNGKKEKYSFKITDYISDIVSGDITSNPPLRLKVHNPTDIPFSETDTIFRNYSWNPKAITLFDGSPTNGTKKAVLKISYSEKK